jgi:GT2 family glycosyltransferase
MKSSSRILVSIIIVTSGSKDYLWHCIDSVKSQSYADLEVIVMDNSLNPDLAAKISQDFPFIKLYSNLQNLYYGASLNKGIGASCGEFVLCLNDDVILERDFIRQALEGFLVKDKVGMVSGKIMRTDGATIDSTELCLSLCYSAKERGYGKKDAGRFNRPGFIFGVSGAVAFYRREMLKDIKQDDYFDHRLRMFYEDLDISWRANRRGWRGYYIPAAKALHVRGGSLRADNGLNKPMARKYLNDALHSDLIKNRYLVILKNATPFGFLVHLIPIILYDLCAWSYVMFFRPKVAEILFKELKIYLRSGFR